MIDHLIEDTAATYIYTLSLHDALPISFVNFRLRPAGGPERKSAISVKIVNFGRPPPEGPPEPLPAPPRPDRKSTRLNSSHSQTSYAVFCLKKKNPYDVRAS